MAGSGIQSRRLPLLWCIKRDLKSSGTRVAGFRQALLVGSACHGQGVGAIPTKLTHIPPPAWESKTSRSRTAFDAVACTFSPWALSGSVREQPHLPLSCLSNLPAFETLVHGTGWNQVVLLSHCSCTAKGGFQVPTVPNAQRSAAQPRFKSTHLSR
jgi:hypothetical protein